MSEERAGGGLFESVRRLSGTLLQTAELRLELLGTELEREKLRIGRGIVLGAAGMLLAAVALLALSAALVLALEPGQRLTALVVLGAAYAALAVGLLRAALAVWCTPTEGPFALSRAELRRDGDLLRPPAP